MGRLKSNHWVLRQTHQLHQYWCLKEVGGTKPYWVATSDRLPPVIQQRWKSHRQLFCPDWLLPNSTIIFAGWLGEAITGCHKIGLRAPHQLMRQQYWCSWWVWRNTQWLLFDLLPLQWLTASNHPGPPRIYTMGRPVFYILTEAVIVFMTSCILSRSWCMLQAISAFCTYVCIWFTLPFNLTS